MCTVYIYTGKFLIVYPPQCTVTTAEFYLLNKTISFMGEKLNEALFRTLPSPPLLGSLQLDEILRMSLRKWPVNIFIRIMNWLNVLAKKYSAG